MIDKLIRCTRCNVIIPAPTDFPGYGDDGSLPGVEWSDDDSQRRGEFLRSHRAHEQEELRVLPDTYVVMDPQAGVTRISYFEAGNGRQRFLIRRTKGGWGSPAYYEIVPALLKISNESLSIQEEDLRREMSHAGSMNLGQAAIERFIRLFREEVKGISPEEAALEMNFTEGETSLLAYGAFHEGRWEKMLERCFKEFEEDEIVSLSQFIRENSGPDDVLAVRIHRKISFLPSVKEKAASRAERPSPGQFSFKF